MHWDGYSQKIRVMWRNPYIARGNVKILQLQKENRNERMREGGDIRSIVKDNPVEHVAARVSGMTQKE